MKFLLTTAALLFFAAPAFADIKLKDVQAFETAEGLKNGAAFMSIENTGLKDDKLIEASTPASAEVEIHEMKETKGVMKMREVGAVAVPAGETVKLEPGGYHLMLIGLKEKLATGKSFPLTLKFQNGGEILTAVKVRSRAAPAGTDHKHMDH